VRFLVLVLCAALLSGPDATAAPAGAADTVAAPHVTVSLVADVDAVRPGTPFEVGIRFVLEEHWHVYWSNPGDSGLAPTVRWTLPEGTTAGPVVWPHPRRILVGPLANFGYEGEVLLPVRIAPSTELAPGGSLALAARVDWLVCREDCIPGDAELRLVLPVTDAAPAASRWAAAFAASHQGVPRAPRGVAIEALRHDDRLELRLTPQGGAPVLAANAGSVGGGLAFFPAKPGLVENAAEQPHSVAADVVTVSLEKSRQRREPVEQLRGTLVAVGGFAPDGAPALAIDVPVREALPAAGAALADDAASRAGSPGAVAGSLWVALGFALLGGILLNVMPCVFPVLSIKVFDFVRQAGGDPARLRRHGYVYAGGVVLSFWVLAATLLVLRAGGEGLGWGFQLQAPAFVVVMVFVLVALALSLLGLFELGLGVSAVAGRVSQGDGFAGSFATGVLATVVATPCTAPFMGPALGWALTQPAAHAMAVFTALGAGMALPYVVLCVVPGWVRLLPRPGAWLETFRQLMAFPLLATALWLLWVLGLQAGIDAVAGTLAGLLLLAAGLWLRGRFAGLERPPRTRRVALACALLLATAGLATALRSRGDAPPAAGPSGAAATTDAYGIPWREYSRATLDELRAAGMPVFVDFTAAWCLTCKVNEHVVFSSREVRDAFAARDVAMLRADWTSRDDEITRALASFGRSGVPLYLLYGAGAEPVVLPSVLTRGVVLDALERIG
jgi:thiol:disulfide interchange protein DsbD